MEQMSLQNLPVWLSVTGKWLPLTSLALLRKSTTHELVASSGSRKLSGQCASCMTFLLTFLFWYCRLQTPLACYVLLAWRTDWICMIGLREPYEFLLVCRTATLGGSSAYSCNFQPCWMRDDGWHDLLWRVISHDPSRVWAGAMKTATLL